MWHLNRKRIMNSSEAGFVRAMARELLVHRQDIKDVEVAVEIAEELLDHTPMSHTQNGDRHARRH
jgi:predicted DsbA family dithiol-disulfide isomerase